jgi:hypothetical protein
MLFVPPHDELSDEEIAEVLRLLIANAGQLPRQTFSLRASVPSISLTGYVRWDCWWCGRSSGDCISDGLRVHGLGYADAIRQRNG